MEKIKGDPISTCALLHKNQRSLCYWVKLGDAASVH